MQRDYRAEAEALRRVEVTQLRTLLLAWDVVDSAVRSVAAILEPLRQPPPEKPEADRA